MRQITDVKRNKKAFNITLQELKKGDWLKEIPDCDLVEITYKSNYLTINDCIIKKMGVMPPTTKSEKDNMED